MAVVASLSGGDAELFSACVVLEELLVEDELKKIEAEHAAKLARAHAAEAAKAAAATVKPGDSAPKSRPKPKSDESRALERARAAARRTALKLKEKLGRAADGAAADDAEASCNLEEELTNVIESTEGLDWTPDGDAAAPQAHAESPSPTVPPPPTPRPDALVSVSPPSQAPTPSLHPPGWLASISVRDLSTVWLSRFETGRTLMRDRHTALQTLAPRGRDNLSCILFQNSDTDTVDAGFFYWARVAHKRDAGIANQVRLDNRKRVKYTIGNSFGTPELPMLQMIADGTAEIIHPDIGVAMLKPWRELIPQDMLELANRFRIAIRVGWPSEAPSCFFCTKPDGATEPIKTCPLCNVSAHQSCCYFLNLERLTKPHLFSHCASAFASDAAIAVHLPPWWCVCALCAASTHHLRVLQS